MGTSLCSKWYATLKIKKFYEDKGYQQGHYVGRNFGVLKRHYSLSWQATICGFTLIKGS
jgi:hypothetical protein